MTTLQKDTYPFCRIARGETPAFIVYEDPMVIGFLDSNPSVDGHCLVIPKQHVPHFQDLKDDQLTALFKAARLVARKIKKAFVCDYVCLFARGGRLRHTHIALIPSFEHDELSGFPQSVINKAAMDLREVAERLRSA